MNTEEALQKIAEAIEARDKGKAPRSWTIVWDKGGFLCIPAQEDWHYAYRLCTFSNDDINYGLTTAQWNTLKSKIPLIVRGC